MSKYALPVRFVLAGLLCLAAYAGCDQPASDTAGKASTYRIVYDGNGNAAGFVPSDDSNYIPGAIALVAGNAGGLEKADCAFGGWNTKPDGTGSSFSAGATMAMGPADLSLYAVWTKQVRYSGLIVLPTTSTPNTDRWYVLVENNTTGERFQTKVGADGFFALSDTQGTREPSTSSIYAYRDQNMDGKMDAPYDGIAYLLTQNNLYSNDAINLSLVWITGQLADRTDGHYGFASMPAMSILKLENRVYWKTVQQLMNSDGSFSIFTVAGHTIDLTLWKVASPDASLGQDYESLLRDPVRLFEPSSFDANTVLHGSAGPGNPIKINKITIRYTNSRDVYSAYPLFILAGQNPISIPAWRSDGSRLTGERTAAVTPLVFYFREFDRTTSTAGALLDDATATTPTGYGSFFSTQVFIDTNRDGVFNTGEPASGKYFHGDLNGNGIPDWGISDTPTAGSTNPTVSNGDYDDGISPSGILADLDMDSSSFLFSL